MTDMCFIENKCYLDGQNNPEAECTICKSNIARTAWTLKEGLFVVFFFKSLKFDTGTMLSFTML